MSLILRHSHCKATCANNQEIVTTVINTLNRAEERVNLKPNGEYVCISEKTGVAL